MSPRSSRHDSLSRPATNTGSATVTVFASASSWVESDALVQCDQVAALDGMIDIVACRTGGRGGQHRNKAHTAVRAIHRPSGTVVVVDTEPHFSLNRRVAMNLLRQRIEDRDEAAGRAVTAARWGVHDELVRGNPTRVERPGTSSQ